MVVPDDQLSLAIGKEGQNARLAAKLTGYKIDIKPASAPLEPIEAPEEELFVEEAEAPRRTPPGPGRPLPQRKTNRTGTGTGELGIIPLPSFLTPNS